MTTYFAESLVYPSWSFGDRLRKARSEVGMNQEEFAEAIGVKEGSLAAWETDRARPRDIVEIAKSVEKVARIPAAWILGVDESPPSPPQGPPSPQRTRKKNPRTGSQQPPEGTSQPVDESIDLDKAA